MPCSGSVIRVLGGVLFILLATHGPLVLPGDDIAFNHLGIEEGLSQGSVYAMEQDQLGYMWFGTQEGLNRYDGYEIEVYKHEPFEMRSLAHSDVDFIFEQGNGTLWVVTQGRLNRYDRETDGFHRFRHDPSVPGSIRPGAVTTTFEDRDGDLWIGTTSGLDLYVPDDGGFAHISPANGAAGVNAMVQDRAGMLWVAGESVLFRLDKGNRVLEPIDSGRAGDFEIPASRRRVMLSDEAGIIWAATTERGLLRYDPRAKTMRLIAPESEPEGYAFLDALMEDDKGRLWMIAGNGRVLRYDNKGTRRFRVYRHDASDPDSLSSDSASLVYEDRRGRIWITTSEGGLNRYEEERGGFTHYRNQVRDPHSLCSDALSQIYEDRTGTIWLGSIGKGLAFFNPTNQKFDHYLKNLGDPKPLQSNLVFALLADEREVWVGTLMDGLIHFDRETRRVIDQLDSRQGRRRLQSSDVRALHRDQRGRIWIGSVPGHRDTGGLDVFDPETDRVTAVVTGESVDVIVRRRDGHLALGQVGRGVSLVDPETGRRQVFGHDPDRSDSLVSAKVRALAEDDDGTLWVGTEAGLSHLDPETGVSVNYRYDVDNPDGLSHNTVIALLVDSMGRLWVGTYGGGLGSMDRVRGTFTHYTTRDGLPNGVIYTLEEDERGMIWMSTNRGLARLDPATGLFRAYDTSDGLQSNEFNLGASYRAPSGELFFGGVDGFNSFFPGDLEDNQVVPQIVVTAIRNATDSGPELASGEEIVLRPGDHIIELRFAALDFSDPGKSLYQYRLNGFDDAWSPPTMRRSATYTNLSHGRYVFEVRASNSDGVWNTEPFTVLLEVLPHPWETWWFRVLVGLAVVGSVVFGAWLSRNRNARQREEALRARDLSRKSEELEFARRLQVGMIPTDNLDSERLAIVGRMITATEVGGDYFDYFRLDRDRVCIVFGDATGHGVAAGLVVGMVKMSATVWSLDATRSLSEMMALINAGLEKSLPSKNLGMGLIMALIDGASGRVEICSSGMPFPYHYSAAKGRIEPLVLKGPPLGYLRKVSIPTHTFRLAPGDRLVFLSDGFNERFNEADQLWGEEALAAELGRICGEEDEPEPVAGRLIEACDAFAGARKNDDDMTVVVVQRHAAGERREPIPLNRYRDEDAG